MLATQLVRPAPYGRAIRLDVRDEGDTARVLLRHGPDAVVHAAYRPAGPELDSAIVKASQSVAINAHRCGARLVHLSYRPRLRRRASARRMRRTRAAARIRLRQRQARRRSVRCGAHPEALIVRTSLLYGRPAAAAPQETLACRDDSSSTSTRSAVRRTSASSRPRCSSSRRLDVAGAAARRRRPTPSPGSSSHATPARGAGLDPDASAAPEPRRGRARNVALDSSRARRLLLGHRLRGSRAGRPIGLSLATLRSPFSPVRRNGPCGPIFFRKEQGRHAMATTYERKRSCRARSRPGSSTTCRGSRCLRVELASPDALLRVRRPSRRGRPRALRARHRPAARLPARVHRRRLVTRDRAAAAQAASTSPRASGTRVSLRTAEPIARPVEVQGRAEVAGGEARHAGVEGDDVDIPYEAIVRGNLIDEG